MAISLGAQGHKVVTSPRGDVAIRVLETQSFDLVLTDLKLPGADGLQVLEAAKTFQPRVPVIMMTAHGTMEAILQALRLGALDFIEKPFDIDEMEARIEQALRQGELVARAQVLREDLLAPYRPENIVGQSPALAKVLDMVRRVAPAKASILISGETGTGKELIAGAVHYAFWLIQKNAKSRAAAHPGWQWERVVAFYFLREQTTSNSQSSAVSCRQRPTPRPS
jgi:DNA-binding NtrC family response regulator